MAGSDENLPDWKDAKAYEPLLGAERALFAWEWLRRNPLYQIAVREAFEGDGSVGPDDRRPRPQDWGLHSFESPHLSVPSARPVWRAEFHPYVLRLVARQPGPTEDAFDLTRLEMDFRIVTDRRGEEYLLISDGFRSIRLDVLSGSIADGPVGLHYLLAGIASAEKPVLTFQRLAALWRTGRFSHSLHPREKRARRWLLMLRAHDALTCGARQREIAAVLLNREAGEPRWRTRSSSVRSQVQRLVQGARRMVSSDYLELLR